MKKQWKGFLSGVIVTTLVFSLGIPALAATVRQLNANYSGIQITLDGKKVEPKDANGVAVEPFAVDGTTYLPLRAMASALGLDVAWDGNTQTVKMTTPGITAAGTYGRTNPAPIGTAQTVSVENFMEKYTATITITESLRGAPAWEKVKAANTFNKPAPDGKEYVLVRVAASVGASDGEKSVHFTTYNFKNFSSTNSEYTDTQTVVSPNPEFNGDVYKGGSIDGYMAVLVDVSDTAPKTVYGANYDGTGGIWLSLTK